MAKPAEVRDDKYQRPRHQEYQTVAGVPFPPSTGDNVNFVCFKMYLYFLFLKYLWPYGVNTMYLKVPKISPEAYIFQRPFLRAYFWRGLSMVGNLRLKIDWASLIFGSKFTVFALFYFVFEGNFPSTSRILPPQSRDKIRLINIVVVVG